MQKLIKNRKKKNVRKKRKQKQMFSAPIDYSRKLSLWCSNFLSEYLINILGCCSSFYTKHSPLLLFILFFFKIHYLTTFERIKDTSNKFCSLQNDNINKRHCFPSNKCKPVLKAVLKIIYEERFKC